MSSPKNAIYKHLAGESGVTDLLSTFASNPAIFIGLAPTNATLPYIAIHKLGTVRGHTLTAANGLAWGSFQIECWAADDNAAEALADAVREVTDGFGPATMGTGDYTLDVRGMFLEDQGDAVVIVTDGSQSPVCGQRLDFRVAYAETIPTFN